MIVKADEKYLSAAAALAASLWPQHSQQEL